MTTPVKPLLPTPLRLDRERRWPRVARAAGLVLLALVALVVLVAAGLWRYASSRIDRIDPPALGEDIGADPLPGTLNVLVVGSDSREGLTEEQLLQLGTEEVGGRRTDTVILVQVSPARERAVLLSFPRDLVVDIPGHGRGKINSVYGKGGPDLLIRTVRAYSGVAVDHYVEVDLAGFLRLTEAVGGVEVCLEQPLRDRFAGVDLPAGCQLLGPVQAAGFVRARHAADEQFGRDDFGRIARQQYFLRQAMREVTSAGTLLNPLRLKRLIDVVAASVTTDRALGMREMLRLANALEGLQPDDVEMRVVPSYPDGGNVLAYPEQAEALFQALREGAPLPATGTEAPRELVPQEVRVTVLNGVGEAGLAAAIAEQLRARGFDVREVGNADHFEHDVTLVQHGPGGRARAELVAGFLPGATVREVDALPDGVDVVVILGADQSEDPGG